MRFIFRMHLYTLKIEFDAKMEYYLCVDQLDPIRKRLVFDVFCQTKTEMFGVIFSTNCGKRVEAQRPIFSFQL